MVIDSGLTMSDHVTAVCRSAYYQLRQLRVIARSLSDDAAKTTVQAFISGRLDYCNTLLRGISDSLIQHLQSVQNAAARLVTGAHQRDHNHTGTEAASLAACEATSRFQDRSTGVKVSSRSHPAVPVGGLPTHHCHFVSVYQI